MKKLVNEISIEIRENKEFTFCIVTALALVTALIVNAFTIGL